MNRKIVALFTAASIALTLTACGKSNRDAKSDDTAWEETTTQPDTGETTDDSDEDLNTEPSDDSPAPSKSPDDEGNSSINPEPSASQKPSESQKPVQTQKPSPSQKPTPVPTKTPKQTPGLTPDPTPSMEPEPTVTPEPTDTPESTVTPQPTPTPSATPTPVPSESPAESPKPDIAAKAIMDSIMDEMGNPTMMEVKQEMLKDVYYIDPSILEQFCVMMPFFNISATEIAIFEVKDQENLDLVLQGIEQRVEKLLKQWENYLPTQYELVKNHKIRENGNFVILVIAKDQQKLLDIFNSFFE